MEAALLDRILLPPPASFAAVAGAGAGGAADAGIALGVEGVAGHVVPGEVSREFGVGPVHQRIQLEAVAGIVQLGGVAALGRLGTAKTGGPGVDTFERSLEGAHLADFAAQAAAGDRIAEEVQAVAADHFLGFTGVGAGDFHFDSVDFAHAPDHVERLGREAAGVDGEDADRGVETGGHVDDGHALILEGSDDGEAPAPGLNGPGQEFLCGEFGDAIGCRWRQSLSTYYR